MVKYDNCGVEVADSFELCPNCGKSLKSSKEKKESPSQQVVLGKCERCGSDLPEGIIFCPSCGSKVDQSPKPKEDNPRFCKKCGHAIEDDVTFCPECGANVFTGEVNEYNPIEEDNRSFAQKINFNSILRPTVIALVASIVLSIIGVLIGFSWVSFIITIILSMGFFGGLIDNEANAIISGLFAGLILGILENPIIAFCWGALAARIYEWYFGGQILLLIIMGVIAAYISNVYLKSKIRGIVGDKLSWL